MKAVHVGFGSICIPLEDVNIAHTVEGFDNSRYGSGRSHREVVPSFQKPRSHQRHELVNILFWREK